MKKSISVLLIMGILLSTSVTCFAALLPDNGVNAWSAWGPEVVDEGDYSSNLKKTALISKIVAALGAKSSSATVQFLGKIFSVAEIGAELYDIMVLNGNVYYTRVFQVRTNASTNKVETRVRITYYYDAARTDVIGTAENSWIEDIVNRVAPSLY